MSVLDNITPEEIEQAVKESPIIRAAVAAETKRCAEIAQSHAGYVYDTSSVVKNVAIEIAEDIRRTD